MGKQEDIDKLFEDALHGYQEAPPADAWGAIQNRMAGEKRKKRAFIIRMAAASVALLVAFGAGYTYKDWESNTIEDKPIVIEQPQNNSILPVQEAEAPINTNKTQETVPTNTVAQESNTGNTTTEKTPVTNTATNVEIDNNSSAQSTTLASNKSGVNKPQATTNLVINDKQFVEETPAIVDKPTLANNAVKLDEQKGNNMDEQPTLAQVDELNPNDTNEIPELIIDPKYKKNLSPNPDARWALGAAATPLYSYRNVSGAPNDGSANSLAAINNNNNEKAILAYAGGINVNYKASSKWEISSGIYYSRQGIQTNNLNVVADATPGTVSSIVNLNNNNFSTNTSSGNVPLGTKGGTIGVVGFTTEGASPLDNKANVSTNAKLVQNFEYFEIPVTVRYNLIQKKVGVHLLGGLSANILSSNYAYVEANGNRESVGETENIRDINYSGVVGVGMDYSITDKLSFNLEPTLRYSITPINENSDINSFLYSMGVFTGLSYNF